jgi:hypothetical protein
MLDNVTADNFKESDTLIDEGADDRKNDLDDESLSKLDGEKVEILTVQ